MPGYFYTHASGQYGPVSGQQLKQLATQGQLVPEDYVWAEGGSQRFLACGVKGLFVMAMPPPVATESRIPEAEVISYGSCVSCPSCQNRIINDGSRAGQAVSCPHCGTPVQMPAGEGPAGFPPIADTFPPIIDYSHRRIAARKSNLFAAMIVPVSMTVAVIGILGFWYFCRLTQEKPSSGGPAPNAVASVAASPAMASPCANMTKREFKNKFYSSIRDALPGVVSEKSVIDAFGEPFRTQTIRDNGYWYWRCKDGTIEMVIQVSATPGALEFVIGKGNLLVKRLDDN